MNERSRLYFEGHITLKPPCNSHEVKKLESIALAYDARVSRFAMIKEGQEDTPDAFISLRDESYTSMVIRIHQMSVALRFKEFIIKRIKIEDTLYDTNKGDPML